MKSIYFRVLKIFEFIILTGCVINDVIYHVLLISIQNLYFWNSLKENNCFPITKMQILVFVKKLTKNFTMFSCLFLLKIFGNCAFAHIMSEICKWIQVEKFLYQKPADLYNLKVHVHFKMYSAVQKNESKVLHTTEVRKFWNIF